MDSRAQGLRIPASSLGVCPTCLLNATLNVRAFVRLRSMLETNAQVTRKLDTLEKSVAVMDAETKRQFKELRAVVFALAAPPAKESSDTAAPKY